MATNNKGETMRKALILFTFLLMTACANKQVLIGKKCMEEADGEFVKTTKSYVWIVDKSHDWSDDINKENCQ